MITTHISYLLDKCCEKKVKGLRLVVNNQILNYREYVNTNNYKKLNYYRETENKMLEYIEGYYYENVKSNFSNDNAFIYHRLSKNTW